MISSEQPTVNSHFSKGLSLLEILVVVSIFAALGILITRSVLLTLEGGRKGESLVKVRENLNYSIGVIERQLRNANSITDCNNTNTSTILYTDQNGNAASFSCADVGVSGSVGYIASGSAKLSSDLVDVTGCSFICELGVAGSPSSVTINFTAIDALASGIQNSSVTARTQVFLRNY